MINLTEYYDDEITINGQKFEVNLTFDNVISFYEMINDKDLSDGEQIIIGIIMLLGKDAIERLDLDLKDLEQILNDLVKTKIDKNVNSNDFTGVDIAGNPMPNPAAAKNNDGEKVMSFKQDADYIYASFMQDYGIDLMEEQGQMHWYKFQALLNGLTDNTKLMKVIEIRTMEIPKGAKAKEKENIEKAKKRYKLKPE